ncbi:unnamed protein product, partial [Ectocarpus sp. 13 AM-2016]
RPSKLRRVGKKDMTLHFVCPVDMTKVAVVTAKVALNVTTGLSVDIWDFLKD